MTAKETLFTGLRERQAYVKLAATTAVMTAVPAMSVFASEVTPPSGSGQSLLTGDLLTSVQGGIANIQATGIQVVGLVVVAGIALVGVSAAANFVIKKVKGILSKAG